jgi:hypothetical protein
MMPKAAEINDNLAEMLRDVRVPAPDRGDMFMYELFDHVIVCRPAVHGLIV